MMDKETKEDIILIVIKCDLDQLKKVLDPIVIDDVIDDVLVVASRYGFVHIVKYAIESGATKKDMALRASAYKGHIETMTYLVSVGACDFDGALDSIGVDCTKTVEFLINHGATKFDGVFRYAVIQNHKKVIIYLIDHGYCKVENAYELIIKQEYQSLFRFLKTM